jgi:prepilin-type N-terminal cleavage/methylation domain-containing protein
LIAGRGFGWGRRRGVGFTLVELAIAMSIIALLMSSLMYTLSAQSDRRDQEETRRRLEQARELVLAFAVANGRLPCPARYTSAASNSGGLESFCPSAATSSTSSCVGSETTTQPTSPEHGTCSNHYDGYLPAASLGAIPVDSSGFAIDAWGNRIRYAVTRKNTNCSGIQTPAHTYTTMFTSKSYLQQYGLSCQPDDLLICKSGAGITSSACGGAANQIMSQSLVAAVIFSTGKNQNTTGGTGSEEATNLKTNAALSPQINPVFVYHAPVPSDPTYGEFDDQFTWIVTGDLFGRLVTAGVLP